MLKNISYHNNNNNNLEVAHPQSDSSSTRFLIELEFGNVGFWGERKTGVAGEKHLGAKERTNNKLNPHMASTPGFEPGPHWWEASALTTAPSCPFPYVKIMKQQGLYQNKVNSSLARTRTCKMDYSNCRREHLMLAYSAQLKSLFSYGFRKFSNKACAKPRLVHPVYPSHYIRSFEGGWISTDHV